MTERKEEHEQRKLEHKLWIEKIERKYKNAPVKSKKPSHDPQQKESDYAMILELFPSPKGEISELRHELKEEKKEEKKLEQKLERYLLKCDTLFDQLTDIKLLKKTSASDTVMAFAKYENLDIMLKISFTHPNVFYNSLTVEEQIYRNIVSNFLNNRVTPHLVRYITSVHACDIDWKKANIDINDTIREIKDTGYNINNANILVIEKSSGVTLSDYIKKIHTTYGELAPLGKLRLQKNEINNLMSAIAQILYTLICFTRITLRHNDLHLSNIFVEQLSEEQEISYKIGDTIYTMKINVMAKIYDFDRGTVYHPAVDRNLELDNFYCEEYGQCSGIQSKRDLSGFIGYLSRVNIPSEVKEWINAVTSPEMRSIMAKRDFPHIPKDEEHPSDKDLKPTFESFSILFKMMPKHMVSMVKGNNKSDKKYDNLYQPPELKKFYVQNPVSAKTHVALEQYSNPKPDPQRLVSYDKKLNDILENLTKVSNLYRVYKKEFLELKYDISKGAKELFANFYRKKPVFEDNEIRDYMILCIMMAIPFWSKLSNEEKHQVLTTITNISTITLKNMIAHEDDIWNLFGGVLPIEMVIV